MARKHRDPEARRTERVSIFVPSRYGTGEAVPPDERQNQVRVVAGVLARIFGGATAEEIEAGAKGVVGTFQHEVTQQQTLVDERILRVWTAVAPRQLSAKTSRQEVLQEARRLQKALKQESVLIEWGREVFFTEPAKHKGMAARFSDLDPATQRDFTVMAWNRVQRPEDLYGLLSLGGWKTDTGSTGSEVRGAKLQKIAWTAKPKVRAVWCWRGTKSPTESDLEPLKELDILVEEVPDSRLRVRLRTPSGWAGPRDIPLATEDRPTSRVALEFGIALLGGKSRWTLEQLLDAETATSRFYRDVREQIAAIEKTARKSLGRESIGFAQRLVGRLLFLRFVEEKGWLASVTLMERWREHQGNYYSKALLPLFEQLNTPSSGASDGEGRAPYLNGGLFTVREEERFDLPDELFNPESERTVLAVLYRYHFTLDETAGREQVVSVDPAMLGRVLESLAPDEARKSKGIHYTPAPIARALAEGGIFSQLIRRARARGIAGVDEAVLRRLSEGRAASLNAGAAKGLQDELHTLKIVDPAVGSGALLMACLEVLLFLDAGLERVMGGDVQQGSMRWAQRARHFVRECLYGVDISPEAVEVAQLRFWLFLAVGEQAPTPLPDLGYNLRVGNSLGFDVAEEQLLRAFTTTDRDTRRMEFSEVDIALNRAIDARRAFAAASEGAPGQRAARFRDLEDAERSLRAALKGKVGRRGEAPPFAWALHFPEVFRGENRGFDLVIANPPYVRTSSLAPEDSAELKARYMSMQSKNVDLYYAFVERALRAPMPLGREKKKNEGLRGLAGRAGTLAFILPSFVQTTSAENLRAILAEGGHVERWVDFVGNQVFPTATNYVALLFATAERRDRKTFEVKLVTPQAFEEMRSNRPWLDNLKGRQVPYAKGGWDIRTAKSTTDGSSRPLRELATVQVGIQTSLDAVYLFERSETSVDDPKFIAVKNELEETVLERAALFKCAKGSRELHGSEAKEGCYVLWPYEQDGSLMTEEKLKAKFPKAWAFLRKNQSRLEEREKGKFRGPNWWRFRRPQGVKSATQVKILVPSMMKEPAAFLDQRGEWVCTASGKGGGGGWVLQPAQGAKTDLAALAAYLRSSKFAVWLRENAEPKKGGWWGVDRKTLERCPIPLSVK